MEKTRLHAESQIAEIIWRCWQRTWGQRGVCRKLLHLSSVHSTLFLDKVFGKDLQ